MRAESSEDKLTIALLSSCSLFVSTLRGQPGQHQHFKWDAFWVWIQPSEPIFTVPVLDGVLVLAGILHFLYSRWCSALFLIQMRIMFITHRWFSCCWVLLILSRPFHFSVLYQHEGIQAAVKKHCQDGYSKLTKGIFHTIEWMLSKQTEWRCLGFFIEWWAIVFGATSFSWSLLLSIALAVVDFSCFQLPSCSYLSPEGLFFSPLDSPRL